MTRLVLAEAVVASALAVATPLIAIANTASAQGVPAVPPAKEISETYLNNQVGLEITLPDGWTGSEIPSVNGTTSVMASPDAFGRDSGNLTNIMMVSIIEKTGKEENTVPESAHRPNVPEDREIECEWVEAEPVQINGMEGVMTIIDCALNGGEVYKTKMYSFQSKERFYMVTYTSNSGAGYDENIGVFDDSVDTLTIENTMEASAIPEFPVAVIMVAVAAEIGIAAVF